MATYDAIGAVSKTILGCLEDARASFAHQPPVLEFKLFHASDFETPTGNRGFTNGTGISLYLYRVAINGSMRNAPRQLAADGKTYRAPLPLDLYYLLTPWANDVEMQQRLLGWCMRILHDTPILPAALINEHTTDVVAFRPTETVELTLEAISFQDMTMIWDKLKPKMQTSVVYIARMITLESTSEIIQAPPVQTRVFAQLDHNGATTR